MNKSIVLILVLLSMAGYSSGQCPVPVNLSSNSVINGNGLNEVQLLWDNVAEALQYSVAYRIDGGGGSYTIKSTSTNSLTITGLPSTTTYEWKVRSVCSTDWSSVSDFSTSDIFTTAAGSSCNAPVNLTSNSTGSGSSINEVDLSWDASSGAVYYNLAYRVQGGGAFTYKTVSTNSYTISGLPASTNYEWKVRTICASDWSVVSAFSSLAAFTSGTGVQCTVPTNVQITNTTGTSFTIAWTSVTGAEQYYIQYRVPSEQTWAQADYRFTYRSSDKTITGLDPDKEYEARMLAICSTDGSGKWTSNSSYSSVVTFNTFQCNTPTGLSSSPGATSATLSWNTVPGALFYQIKYRKTGVTNWPNNVETANGSTSSVQISNLDPNTSYQWIIRTRCSLSNTGLNSDYSAIQSFTTVDGTNCVTPTNLSATPSTTDAFIDWDAVPTAIDYQLKWREQGQSAFLNSAIITDPTTSYTIDGLTSSTTYEWLIRARCSVDGSNDSPYSSIQTFTTDAGPSCDTPTNLNSSPSSTSATLSWNPVSLATQYRLKYRVQGAGAFTNTVIVTAPSSSTNITGLTPSTTYEWLVRTECPGENSTYTAIQVFTTSASMSMAESTSARTITENTTSASSQSSDESNIAKFNESNADTFSDFQLKIFPNPTRDFINISSGAQGVITIVNTLGETIKEFDVSQGEQVAIEMSSYGSGMYLVKFHSKENKIVKRVIVN